MVCDRSGQCVQSDDQIDEPGSAEEIQNQRNIEGFGRVNEADKVRENSDQ